MYSAFVLRLEGFEFKVLSKCEGIAAPLPIRAEPLPSPDKVLGKDTDVSSLLPRVQPSSALGAEVFILTAH